MHWTALHWTALRWTALKWTELHCTVSSSTLLALAYITCTWLHSPQMHDLTTWSHDNSQELSLHSHNISLVAWSPLHLTCPAPLPPLPVLPHLSTSYALPPSLPKPSPCHLLTTISQGKDNHFKPLVNPFFLRKSKSSGSGVTSTNWIYFYLYIFIYKVYVYNLNKSISQSMVGEHIL